jgi:hypothetical protein
MAYLHKVNYPAEATLGDQRLRQTRATIPRKAIQPPSSVPARRRKIALLAYELYLRRGKVHGHDVEDWLAAEAIVRSRLRRGERPTGDHANGKETE